ncbi:hypothetical protein HK101_011372 [Irineochytrium annulatum]|nr:hypothetical protein HK101_011372 [Irineochytrium annulatum]
MKSTILSLLALALPLLVSASADPSPARVKINMAAPANKAGSDAGQFRDDPVTRTKVFKPAASTTAAAKDAKVGSGAGSGAIVSTASVLGAVAVAAMFI